MRKICISNISSRILLVILFLISNVAFAQISDSKEEISETRPTNNINLSLVGEGALISIAFVVVGILFLVS